MPRHPTEEIDRSLKLVAKIIQNLANMVMFGQKEKFLEPCNPYLTEERPRMQRFLDAVAVSILHRVFYSRLNAQTIS